MKRIRLKTTLEKIMKLDEGFMHSMQDAMNVLRTRGPHEATEAIRRAMSGQVASPFSSDTEANRPIDESTTTTGTFTTHRFASAAGERDYKLYMPRASTQETAMPLIVMLHGCTQDADDFAAGTQMNALADTHGFIVAYPVQPQRANASKCWNWFKPADQLRDAGEPSLIAGITREIIGRHAVDPARVYVAGLSAGGAMTAIMIRAYPDLYAAACVHSGLAAGSARDLPSALGAMKGGKRSSPAESPKRPVIVFHGDADKTVHPSNAADVMRGFDGQSIVVERPAKEGERASTVELLVSANGVSGERWTIHGAPHAWAGGSRRGTYTDAGGPDASAEMLRFFLEHPMNKC